MMRKKQIFIIEDNAIYSKQLVHFLKGNLEGMYEISAFPVGEWMEVKLENNIIPDVVIMDNYLDTRFLDAKAGINLIDKYRLLHPQILFILHSGQPIKLKEEKNPLLDEIIFVEKNADANKKLLELIEG